MKIGDKLNGRITGIQPYGAFVELETGVTGLIHISEIRTGFIENIHDVLKVGEEVQVQVVDFDEFTGKASLSIRTLEEEKHQLPRRRRFSSDRYKYGFAPLGQMMPIWTKEALSNLNEMKH
ncbi:S1 RNA binding domain protein [Streptococcus peroris ATCC 700780]|uniref:S1 RNA binding domain protein n=2 Tax=Streptococcus TaxID=1301 RepID=E8KAL4_9STRE|nr:S1 RNA binding domain protein [Streptococcus peroris ATCC 700780]OHS86044.1 RNA-binding protein [Streptococcus sp. HMSC34B10]